MSSRRQSDQHGFNNDAAGHGIECDREAALHATVQQCCAQDVMFAMQFVTSIGLTTELQVALKADNNNVVDVCRDWSVGGWTRQIEVK